MKRRMTIAAAVSLSLLLTACASGSSGGGAVRDTEPDKNLPIAGETLTYDPNTLVNDGEPITLEWWAWDEANGIYQEFVDEYKEIHPNVDIQLVNQPWDDYWTKLPLLLREGKGPAIFNVHNSYHENLIGGMEPYDIPVADLIADYEGVEAHVIEDEVYYLDFGLMTGLIFYNKDMWAEAGLTEADIPETWDEFEKVAEQLTLRDGAKVTQAGFNFNSYFAEFSQGLPYQLGSNLFENDQKTPNLDNPAMLEVIERFQSFYDEAGVGSKDFGPEAAESFGQGQSAMMYHWGHFYGTLQGTYPDLDFGTFRTPVPEAGVEPYAYDRYNGESTIGVNAGASENEKAAAQDFLRFYLTNKDLMKELALNASVFPMYKPLADDPDVTSHPVMGVLGSIDRYIWPGPLPASVHGALVVMWEDILYNGVPAKKALAEAQATVQSNLAETQFSAVEDQYRYYVPAE